MVEGRPRFQLSSSEIESVSGLIGRAVGGLTAERRVPADDIVEQLRQMERTTRELDGDPSVLLEQSREATS